MSKMNTLLKASHKLVWANLSIRLPLEQLVESFDQLLLDYEQGLHS